MTDQERAIYNERTKLLATYLNNIAVALVAVGILAPLIGRAVGSSAPSPLSLVGLTLICIIISTALHIGARKTLGRLLS